MALVFLPYVELPLLPPMVASLGEVKGAGFDGVECHLIGRLRSPTRVMELREEADKLNLGIRFHQGWSWETGQRGLYNVVLRFLGALVPIGVPIARQVCGVGDDPVVMYGNHITNELRRPNFLYQTCSERRGSHTVSFASFVDAARNSGAPVVFDNQHALEWYGDEESVVGLPVAPAALGQMASRLWQGLGPLTREIHLCDFNPTLGSSRGRNLFLGDGIFPLEEFCTGVRASGWDGVVTPEVALQHLRGKGKLQMLREIVGLLLA